MSNKQLTNTIKLLGLRNKTILIPFNNGHTSGGVYMMAINEEEEKIIDKRSDKTNIFFYGDININNPNDIKIIKDYNFVHRGDTGHIYSTFDYENANFTLVPRFNGRDYVPEVLMGPCTDPIRWFKYQHCLLGKPAKVVVYRAETYEFWKSK